MSVIPYANLEKSPEKVQAFFEKMKANTGGVGNLFRMAAHSPATVREFTRYGDRLLFKAELDDKFRELCIILVSLLCQSRYEWAHHVPIALRTGVTSEQLEQIENWRGSDLFSEQEKVILAFTEEVVKKSRPAPETFKAASDFLDNTSLVELTLSIGHWSMVANVLNTFQVDVEDDFLEANKELLPDNGPA